LEIIGTAMVQNDNVTGLILAGGAGTRVGGQDKGLLPWRGKTLVEHVTQRLHTQTAEVLISCNRSLREYQSLGFRTVQDRLPNFQGPLAGIEAAMDFVKTDYLLVVACDTPLLPLDLATRLMAPLLQSGDPAPLISFAHDGQRGQYLFALLNRRCQPSLAAFLAQGHRSVKQWYQQIPHEVVDFSDQTESFQNYNYVSAATEGPPGVST